MKIPINYAIDSGSWFRCETEGWMDQNILFKLKVFSFVKVDLGKIDEPNKLKLDEGILWAMKIQVINVTKEEIDPGLIKFRVILFDQDDFKFNAVYNDHLNYSKFGETVGIKRFAGGSDIPKLKPKIKAAGALPFLLPDDDVAEYFLSVEGGNILEV